MADPRECQMHPKGCIHRDEQALVYTGRGVFWQRGSDSVTFTMTGRGATKRAASMWESLRATELGDRTLLDLLMDEAQRRKMWKEEGIEVQAMR